MGKIAKFMILPRKNLRLRANLNTLHSNILSRALQALIYF